MQELMATLQEVDFADVRQILREPAAVASGGTTAVAVADQDTAIAVADQDTAVAVADQDTAAAVADQDTAVAVADLVLRREAIEWATKSKYQSFIANLVDTLPPAVLDEQVRLHQASKCGPVVPHAPQAIVVYPHLLKSRQEAAHTIVRYGVAQRGVGARDTFATHLGH